MSGHCRRRRRARLFAATLGMLVTLAPVAACSTSTRGVRRLARSPRAEGAPSSSTRAPGGPPATVDAEGMPEAASLVLVDSDVRLEFDLPAVDGGGPRAVTLGARLTRARDTHGPGFVLVPGGGDVSRDGRRKGDGVTTYAAPVDVGREWARALAGRGALVLTYDKRTCGANDDPLCTTNPQEDVDAGGPVALARDLDAACERLRLEPGFDGRLVLLAHGQAGQVALASTCAQRADAVVLLSPIPRAVDAVLVDALVERQGAAAALARSGSPEHKATHAAEAARLKDLAGSRAASFASMKDGRFSPGARVDGATISFWLGWIELTTATPALVDAVKDKLVVVLGDGDRQLSSSDRSAAAALPARAHVVVEAADHHLLIGGQLSPAVVEPVCAAVDGVLGTPGT